MLDLLMGRMLVYFITSLIFEIIHLSRGTGKYASGYFYSQTTLMLALFVGIEISPQFDVRHQLWQQLGL